ncbi:MAG: hypothetical protein E7089_06555 [Bacteroidales bacterium]|nr:hypothetical protein [Bacteroidales bacterium]
MDNLNFEKEEKVVKDILTPKHTPECNIKFDVPKKKQPSKLLRYIRITAVAAALASLIFVATRINFIEETQAAVSPMKMISKGIEKFTNVKSLYLEFQTLERIRIGLPVTEDKKMRKCKLYFLQADSAVYMREEWDDEYNTIAIYDKDSLHLWQNGELQRKLKIPFRPARYEHLFNAFTNMIHKEEEEENGYVVVTEKPNDPPTEENRLYRFSSRYAVGNIPIEEIKSIEVIKEEKVIKLETEPAAEYEPFYILIYSAEKEEFTEFKIVKEEKNSDERTILFETTKLVYNYPNTVRKITQSPK